ncbi:MAG TPA: hypothetical protein VE244_09480 [Nitrososphaeraceae archaeon]|jgi:hypothetical protein|nr:hypothetical protein [Nitrososphaeraceae archaeon]
MGGKIRDIKETTSNAAEIIRQFGTPEMQMSLDKIKETARTAQSIIESLKDPEMVKNIENLRLTTEAIQNTSMEAENMVKEIKQTGVINEVSATIKSLRITMDSVESNQNFAGVISAIKEMLESIAGLVEELKITIASSKKTGTIYTAEEAVREASKTYKNIKDLK